jgi:hypothetical protein
MGVKKIVVDRLDKAKSFAESVRGVYLDAYQKAVDLGKGGLGELVKDIEPKVRAVIDEKVHSAQEAFDELNKSLADKAIPAFRKKAVSSELLEQKSKRAVKRKDNKSEVLGAEPLINADGKASSDEKVKVSSGRNDVKPKSRAKSPRKKNPVKK